MHTTGRQGTGDRVLTGRDCRLLIETAALTLALAIAPKASSGSNTPKYGDDESPPVPRGRPVAVADELAPRPGREIGGNLSGRGLVAADWGSFPGTSVGVGAAVSTRLGRWRVEARAAYWPEQTTTLDEDPTAGAKLSTMVGGVRGCFQLAEGHLNSEICAGSELLRTTGRGFGGFNSEAGSWLWIRMSAGPSFTVKLLKHIAIRLDTEGVLSPFRRPIFALSNVEPGNDVFVLHTPAWVAAQVSAGLEVSFP